MSLAELTLVLVVAILLLGPKQWEQWLELLGVLWKHGKKLLQYKQSFLKRLEEYAELASNQQRARDAEQDHDR